MLLGAIEHPFTVPSQSASIGDAMTAKLTTGGCADATTQIAPAYRFGFSVRPARVDFI
jgi:hypothetical protein